MKKKDPRLATMALNIAARLEMDSSLGVSHFPLKGLSSEELSAFSALLDKSVNPWEEHSTEKRQQSASAFATEALNNQVRESVVPERTVPIAPPPQAVRQNVEPAVRREPSPATFKPSVVENQSTGFTEFDSGSSERMEALLPLRTEVMQCSKCRLCERRNHVIFGEGSLDTDLVFVGEAPGREEDERGRPFVGRAGKMLTAIIENGMKRPRSSVYICNIIKCRPPGNRDPKPDETMACMPYLQRQLEVIKPKVIVTIGRIAANILTDQQLPMGKLRGNWFDYQGIPLMPIYHTAYLLRQRDASRGGKTDADRKTWGDIQKVMKLLNGK